MSRTPLISQVMHVGQVSITQVNDLNVCQTPLISQVTHVGQGTITQVKDLSCVSHTTHVTIYVCGPEYNHTGKVFIMCVEHHSYHK